MSQKTQDGTPYSYVKLVSDKEDNDQVWGRFWPQIIQTPPTNRVNIFISSENKLPTSESDFDFYVDLRQESGNVRSIQLMKAILPLAPQINDHNNVMNVTLNGNTFNVTLDNGYYNPNSFVNMLQAKLSAAWNTAIAGATVTVSYNPAERNITIEDTSPGPGPYNWQFNASPYSRYGLHVAYFPLGVSGVTQTSTSLEMIYSRYYAVRSNRLCDNQRATSLTSSYQPTNIVAILPVSEYYDSTQFSPSASFPGTAKTMDCYDTSPVINTTNKNVSLRVLDLHVSDEFGFSLYTIFNDGSFAYTCAFLFVGNVY
jgi:hypothetical protein